MTKTRDRLVRGHRSMASQKSQLRQLRLCVEPLEQRCLLAVDPVFQLHSNPGASHTIHLDFDGHTTTGTTWNSSYGVTTINSPPYNTDGDSSTFSASEKATIQAVWSAVAEDFAPFNVNVTTEDPGASALSRSGSGDSQWGTRVVITNDTFAGCGCGGHAYVGSFDDSTDEPVFVYVKGTKQVTEAASHEVGHAMGLSHDGSASGSYYYGHGNWGPIMGVSYNRSVSQWSKGQYYTATNTQDDLAIITSSSNGFGYRSDDHGDSNSNSTALPSNGNSLNGSGIIERTSDVDVFTFTTGNGNVRLNINPASSGPNLNVRAELYDASNSLIDTSDDTGTLGAAFDVTLPQGQYYLRVMGTGEGNPTSSSPSGYTEYGSLGQYTISGSFVDMGSVPILSIGDAVVDENAGTASLAISLNEPAEQAIEVVYSTSNGTAVLGSDYISKSGTVTFSPGQTTQWVSVQIIDDNSSENSEYFNVDISTPSSTVLVSDGEGRVTINDNDASLSIAGTSGNEGNLAKGRKNSGNATYQTFSFSVSLSSPLSRSVNVNYATSDGTATTTDSDYLATNGTLTFAPGETNKTIAVTVVGDNDVEANETFSVQLSGASGAGISSTTANATIVNDDSSSGTKTNNGRGNRNRIASEIEIVDPVWWFDADHVHHHHHDGHDHLGHDPGCCCASCRFVETDVSRGGEDGDPVAVLDGLPLSEDNLLASAALTSSRSDDEAEASLESQRLESQTSLESAALQSVELEIQSREELFAKNDSDDDTERATADGDPSLDLLDAIIAAI